MNLSNEILRGNITALSKGITLIESNLDSDIKNIQKLVSKCLPFSGKSIRIGITGIPGVGKSTFIDTFGKILTSNGYKVAVLAIDPSSKKSSGSILGDKSRMNKLSSDKNAFIRPSPNSGNIGGLSKNTRESIILCEAAGFNIILIETVGVGQSETDVSNICDFFLLLMITGAGDELQAIKRGIIELADAIIINKADGENKKNAKITKNEYQKSLELFPVMENGWVPKIDICSSTENIGMINIWNIIQEHDSIMKNSGWKIENRKRQDIYWLHQIIKEELGKNKYKLLKTNGILKKLETDLIKEKNISKIISNII
tara:strand:- start:13349 stop:14293 length:945 start_codon:yes stop_codon:yes gene_type:complete